MNILRVFPRRTKATPDDDMAFVGDPPLPAFRPDADEVHVSCTFTWDVPEANRLFEAWSRYYSVVYFGGPAYGAVGGEFVPSRYVKEGMVITSRGCPNHCPHCFVPQREGRLRELPIRDGWDVLDNNLLACSEKHIEAVLDMLGEQPKPAKFTGGLQASLVQPWFVKRLAKMRLLRAYTAYDTPGSWFTVELALERMLDAGLNRTQVCCYVLVGQPDDTIQAATDRCEAVKALGATPFAMYYLGPFDTPADIAPEWRAFRRSWSRPAAIFAKDRK